MPENESRNAMPHLSGGYDLHTHSTYSDGSVTPAQLVVEAAQVPLRGFALTDHDTAAGWSEAQRACDDLGIEFMPGMEITTKYEGASTHLLAYGFDEHDAALNAELDRVRESRLGRAQEMVRRLSSDFQITWDDVFEGDASRTVGRPHIADALIRAGFFENRDAAFATVLSSQSPYYVHTYAIDTAAAVGMVRQAGGVTVLAHPAAARHVSVITDEQLAGLVAAGLWGIELRHPENVRDRLPRLLGQAALHRLHVTGSSDYHGVGKKNRLGEHQTDSLTWQLLQEAVSRPA